MERTFPFRWWLHLLLLLAAGTVGAGIVDYLLTHRSKPRDDLAMGCALLGTSALLLIHTVVLLVICVRLFRRRLYAKAVLCILFILVEIAALSILGFLSAALLVTTP